MRRILQASLLCTCINSTLALGCRNSQHCCTPCCYPSAAGQPVPAAPTPVPTAAPVPGQAPAATMPLVQDGSPAAAPTAPPTPLPPGMASLASPAPTSPPALPGLPLPTGEPSPAPSAPTSQETQAAPQAGTAPVQQPSSAEQSEQSAQAAGSLPAANPTASGSLYHDPAYHSLVGVLDYVAIQKGWVLRYAAPEEEDRYGGCVTLIGAGSMKGFHSGQRVQVRGELVDAASLKPHPAYRVFSLQPLGPQG